MVRGEEGEEFGRDDGGKALDGRVSAMSSIREDEENALHGVRCRSLDRHAIDHSHAR